MKNKKNKKKLLVALLLFAITGVVGFGVYSYYYTSGRIITEDETIEISSFDPVLYESSGYIFIHGTHYTTDSTTCSLTNYNSSTNVATYHCTSDFDIQNHGSNDIYITASNTTLSVSNSGSNNYTVRNEAADASECSNVSTGSSCNVYLSADIDIEGISVDPSSISQDAQYASEPVTGASLDVNFEVDVTATEVH